MRSLAVACLALACAQPRTTPMTSTLTPPPPSPPPGRSASPLTADAVAGTTNHTLRGVLADHWEHMMRWQPTWATTLGDHRYDDQLAPRDAAAIERSLEERRALLARLVAIGVRGLTAEDQLTRALLQGRLEAELAMDACKLHEWTVDAGGSSLLGELAYLTESHLVKTPADATNLIARMRQGEAMIAATIANLERGLAAKRVAAAEKVRRAVAQLDTELAKPIDAWSMAAPPWTAQPAYAQQRAELREVVAAQLQPALAR